MIRCYVTNRHQGDLLPWVNAAIRDGVDMIQIREKDMETRALHDLVCRIRDAAAGTSTKILVNDRLDIAMAANVDGVHLPANGLPASRVRPFVRVMGCSTHTLEEVLQAERDGADFVIFGPVFETAGKVPVGLDALRSVAGRARIPVLAIGGITQENAGDVVKAGAAGIAAIRLFQKG
ncbi:MAG TPA: thiamine phosphate synthase [Terriglobia bacterium]|nr:thiamine phosphate synthase [Terriglobia bacterium]